MRKAGTNGRVTRPVNLTLRAATIMGIRAVAASQYASVSRYVDGVLTEHLAQRQAKRPAEDARA